METGSLVTAPSATFLEVAMKRPHRRRFLRLATGAMRTLAVVLALLVASGVAQIAAVQAADINAFISTAIKAVTDELLPPAPTSGFVSTAEDVCSH